MALTDVADVVVPERFTGYARTRTEEKSRLIQSGAVARSQVLDELLAGGGKTFNVPGWRPLPQTAENVTTDTAGASTPEAITSHTEIAARLSRNQSWGAYALAGALAGDDPEAAIADFVADYWAIRLQKMIIAMVSGINKDNGVNDSGDYAHDIAGASYVAGVTDFSAEALIDAKQTMGDSSNGVSLLMMHSIVHARAKKNNLIDTIRDSENNPVDFYDGMLVVVDDGMPSGTAAVLGDGTAGEAGIYETWAFAPGAVQLGVGSPPNATATERTESAGNGGGQSVLFNRVEWAPHMPGHAIVAAAIADGGPSNAATTNNLDIATSWNRVYPERKMIKFARLVTREA